MRPVTAIRVTTRRAQRGAVLVISLLFLTILTILGVASMRGTVLQERMAFNTREQNLALQAAEAALRDAELWLLAHKGGGKPPEVHDSCSSNCYAIPAWTATAPAANPAGHTYNWWARYGRQHGQDTLGNDNNDLDSSLHARQPWYLVQALDATGLANSMPASLAQGHQYGAAGPWYYRLSAYGVGKTAYFENGTERHIDVVVQSLFAVTAF